ncbi:MAG: hypothetical protein DRQ98_10175 [Gammaproteobacteria bacterium]|nr:MAG: hypothetical protein DRQ98_10175 [Gammaproteobacteria bacterium]
MGILFGSNKNTLGRGRLFFDRFADGTTNKTGELYLGNTPEFNLTVEPETLEHYDSDAGLKFKDESTVLQFARAGSFVTDNINLNNLALFFFGTQESVTQAATPVADEAITVLQGRHYQLGATVANPPGVRNVGTVVVQDDTDTTTWVEDTDYSLDEARGRIYIIPGGGISDDDVLHVDYTPVANTRTRIVSADQSLYGGLRFESANPVGDKNDHLFPKTLLTPNGDYALKGDEWQQMSFNVEILTLDDATSPHYIDGQPA